MAEALLDPSIAGTEDFRDQQGNAADEDSADGWLHPPWQRDRPKIAEMP